MRGLFNENAGGGRERPGGVSMHDSINLDSGVRLFFFLLLAMPGAAAENHALRFDGDNDRLMVEEFPPITGPFTVDAWVRTGTSGGGINPRIVELVGAEDTSFRLRLDGDRRGIVRRHVLFEIHFGPGVWQYVLSTKPLEPQQWYHVAGVYDGSIQALYIDGVLVDSRPASGNLRRNTTLDIGTAAGIWTGDNDCFDGEIDEVRLWERGMGQEEIQLTMHLSLDGDEEGLIGYWPLDEGEGQTAYDLSAGENHASLGTTADGDDHDPLWVSSDSPVRSACPRPSDLTCAPDRLSVKLSWSYPRWGGTMRIWRDTQMLAEVSCEAGGFVDADPPVLPGRHEYSLQTDYRGRPCEPISCSVLVPPVCIAADDLVCESQGRRVALRWTNAHRWDNIEVLRDGETIDILADRSVGPDSWSDRRAPIGEHVYAIRAKIAGQSCELVACRVEAVGFFVRGDANSDGGTDIADAVPILSFLFVQGRLSCVDAADANDNGMIEIGDAIGLVNFLFQGGIGPHAPFPRCGPDSTPDGLKCESHSPCE